MAQPKLCSAVSCRSQAYSCFIITLLASLIVTAHTVQHTLNILLRGQCFFLLRGFSRLSKVHYFPSLKSSSSLLLSSLLPSIYTPPSQVLKYCFIKTTLTPGEKQTQIHGASQCADCDRARSSISRALSLSPTHLLSPHSPYIENRTDLCQQNSSLSNISSSIKEVRGRK